MKAGRPDLVDSSTCSSTMLLPERRNHQNTRIGVCRLLRLTKRSVDISSSFQSPLAELREHYDLARRIDSKASICPAFKQSTDLTILNEHGESCRLLSMLIHSAKFKVLFSSLKNAPFPIASEQKNSPKKLLIHIEGVLCSFFRLSSSASKWNLLVVVHPSLLHHTFLLGPAGFTAPTYKRPACRKEIHVIASFPHPRDFLGTYRVLVLCII